MEGRGPENLPCPVSKSPANTPGYADLVASAIGSGVSRVRTCNHLTLPPWSGPNSHGPLPTAPQTSGGASSSKPTLVAFARPTVLEDSPIASREYQARVLQQYPLPAHSKVPIETPELAIHGIKQNQDGA